MFRQNEHNILYLVLFLIVGLETSSSKILKPVYWNVTSPSFTDNRRPHIRTVQIGDKLDVICPIINDDTSEELYYLALYAVSEESFNSCNTIGQKRLMTCNVPEKEKKYTFLFQEISPAPWGLEFVPGQTYYYISTSDGTEDGLYGEKGGVCAEKNMRMKIQVTRNNEDDMFVPVLDDVIPPTIEIKKDPQIIKRPVDHPIKLPDNPSFYQGDNDIDTYHPNGDNIHNTNINNHNDGNVRQTVDVVNGNGLVIGVVLGACAVLFIVLLSFLGYKVHRRRRHDKKYRSPSMTPTRGVLTQGQVTLLPTPGHHQNTVTHLTHHSNGTQVLHMGEYRPPPPYDETVNMDHAGSTVEV